MNFFNEATHLKLKDFLLFDFWIFASMNGTMYMLLDRLMFYSPFSFFLFFDLA